MVHYTRGIAFRRSFLSTSFRPSWLMGDEFCDVYPFETDDHKVKFVDVLFRDPSYFADLYVDGIGKCHVKERGAQFWHCRNAIQFVKPIDSDDDPRIDGGVYMDRGVTDTINLVFCLHTRKNKLAFAQWVEDTRFGEFRKNDAQVFLTKIVTANAPPSIAEVEKKKRGIEAVSELLYEHREEMKEDIYLHLNKAFKTAHEEVTSDVGASE